MKKSKKLKDKAPEMNDNEIELTLILGHVAKQSEEFARSIVCFI